jgi:hypothetical protein
MPKNLGIIRNLKSAVPFTPKTNAGTGLNGNGQPSAAGTSIVNLAQPVPPKSAGKAK